MREARSKPASGVLSLLLLGALVIQTVWQGKRASFHGFGNRHTAFFVVGGLLCVAAVGLALRAVPWTRRQVAWLIAVVVVGVGLGMAVA